MPFPKSLPSSFYLYSKPGPLEKSLKLIYTKVQNEKSRVSPCAMIFIISRMRVLNGSVDGVILDINKTGLMTLSLWSSWSNAHHVSKCIAVGEWLDPVVEVLGQGCWTPSFSLSSASTDQNISW